MDLEGNVMGVHWVFLGEGPLSFRWGLHCVGLFFGESLGVKYQYVRQKCSRLRCLLRVKGLVIFFIWAGLAVFFSSDKI